MLDQSIKIKAPHITESISRIRYGCVFCITGRKESVAVSLEAQNPGLKATFVSLIKWHTVNGIREVETRLLFPGYVYFKTESSEPPDLLYIQDSVRLLETTKYSWILSGMDAWFAQWVFENHGVIGFSRAKLINNLIEFIEGPLYDLKMKGCLKKVDRRHGSALVVLPFHNREAKMWLMYDLVE